MIAISFSPVNALKSGWMKIRETFLSTRRNEAGEKKISPEITLNQIGLMVSKFSLSKQLAAVRIFYEREESIKEKFANIKGFSHDYSPQCFHRRIDLAHR